MPDAREPRVPPIDDDTLTAYRTTDGQPMELFQAVAHSPAALADLKGATARSLDGTVLPVRQRELLILRILHDLHAEAEWDIHIDLFGEQAGLRADDLATLRSAEDALSGADALMLAVADALAAGGRMSDTEWQALVGEFGMRGAVEAVFVGAQYVKVAIMSTAFGIAPRRP